MDSYGSRGQAEESAATDKHSHIALVPLSHPVDSPGAVAMRESNFAFPAQNRACVCITAQLYDRRGVYLISFS
jgi:hypothetical protein